MVINFKILILAIGLTLIFSCAKNEGISVNDATPAKFLYVTAATSNGNIGGIAAADTLCMNDVNYPGTGTYKALITDGVARVACTTNYCSGGASEHTDWVLQPATYYFRKSDEVIVGLTNDVGLFTMNLESTFASTGSDNVWMGFGNEWKNNMDDCTNWGSSAGWGDYGKTDQVDVKSIYAASGLCSNTGKIVCVEQ